MKGNLTKGVRKVLIFTAKTKMETETQETIGMQRYKEYVADHANKLVEHFWVVIYHPKYHTVTWSFSMSLKMSLLLLIIILLFLKCYFHHYPIELNILRKHTTRGKIKPQVKCSCFSTRKPCMYLHVLLINHEWCKWYAIPLLVF